MAISWTKLIPRWAGIAIEPPESKKDDGWLAGDKPPAKWWNWLLKGMYEAVTENRQQIDILDSGKVAKAGDFMTARISYNTANGGVQSANNASRVFLAGGSGLSISNGSFVTVEGKDYGGTGLGGNVSISVPSNKGIAVNTEGVATITSIMVGNGSPEGTRAANVGSLYLRADGGAGTTLYVKESGTGNTGWVAK